MKIFGTCSIPLSYIDLRNSSTDNQSIKSVWALLHEAFCKNWEDNIKMTPKLRTCIKFKKFLRLNNMFCHL